MSFSSSIMNSVYQLEQECIALTIGLSTAENNGNYPVKIEIVSTSFDTVSKIIFNVDDFYKLRYLIDITISNHDNCGEKVKSVVICDDEKRIDAEIGGYIVTLFKKTGIIRFSEMKLYLISKPILDISLQNWLQIKNRFASVINYKVIFLKKYSLYARLVHGRIVNYYINQVKNTNPLHFTLDFLMNDIINLHTLSLIHISEPTRPY